MGAHVGMGIHTPINDVMVLSRGDFKVRDGKTSCSIHTVISRGDCDGSGGSRQVTARPTTKWNCVHKKSTPKSGLLLMAWLPELLGSNRTAR